jgi:hypothetical protein
MRDGTRVIWSVTPVDEALPDAPDGCVLMPAIEEGDVPALRVPVEATASGIRDVRGEEARSHATPPLPATTFCGESGGSGARRSAVQVSAEVERAADEIVALGARDQNEDALTRYREAYRELDEPPADAILEVVQRAVVDRLTLYAAAQLAGLQDDETPFTEAGDIYEAWGARRVLDEHVFIDQLLDIVAEAQLLNRFELAEDAMRRAGEILLEQVDPAFASYDPCTATSGQTQAMRELLARLQLFGVPGASEGELYDRFNAQIGISLREGSGYEVDSRCPERK